MGFLSNIRSNIQKKRVAAIKERQAAKTERQVARKTGRLERKLAKRQLRKTYDGKFQDLETGEQFTESQVQGMDAQVVDQAGRVVQEYGSGEEKVSSKTNPALVAGIIVGGTLLVGTTIFLIVRATSSKNK